MPLKLGYTLIVAISLFNCKKNGAAAGSDLIFDSIPVVKPIAPTVINETSGIADSKINPGHLWVHEDSGTPTQLYLLKHDGTIIKRIFIKGVVNRDWEDMVLSGNDLYIGDIGDNNSVYPDYTIYRFAEPAAGIDTVQTTEAIRFRYADGSYDAEGFLVDPLTKDIYILTKRSLQSRVYKISFPYSTNINTATLATSLPYNGVVSAAMSNDGKEIILKTYSELFYYSKSSSETIDQALQKTPKKLGYKTEPQGEAITFAQNGSGFFTLSEKGFAAWVNLYFYRRK